MKQRVLGKRGLDVSAIGLGCIGLSDADGPATANADAIALVRSACDRGVTCFDSAQAYPRVGP